MDVLCSGTQPTGCSTIYIYIYFFVSVPHPPRKLRIDNVTSDSHFLDSRQPFNFINLEDSVILCWEHPLGSKNSNYIVR
jgi:hypothetical protein